jgi:hypothetical protein
MEAVVASALLELCPGDTCGSGGGRGNTGRGGEGLKEVASGALERRGAVALGKEVLEGLRVCESLRMTYLPTHNFNNKLFVFNMFCQSFKFHIYASNSRTREQHYVHGMVAWTGKQIRGCQLDRNRKMDNHV